MFNRKIILSITMIVLSLVLSTKNHTPFLDNVINVSFITFILVLFKYLYNFGAYDSMVFSLGKFKNHKSRDEDNKKKYKSFSSYIKHVNESRSEVHLFYFILPIVYIGSSLVIKYYIL